MTAPDSQANLLVENARLVALLEANGIDWRSLPEPILPSTIAVEPEPAKLSTEEKVALFRRLFRGRNDVYPIRWESIRPASLATHPPAPTSGARVFAKSHASSVRIAAIDD